MQIDGRDDISLQSIFISKVPWKSVTEQSLTLSKSLLCKYRNLNRLCERFESFLFASYEELLGISTSNMHTKVYHISLETEIILQRVFFISHIHRKVICFVLTNLMQLRSQVFPSNVFCLLFMLCNPRVYCNINQWVLLSFPDIKGCIELLLPIWNANKSLENEHQKKHSIPLPPTEPSKCTINFYWRNSRQCAIGFAAWNGKILIPIAIW